MRKKTGKLVLSLNIVLVFLMLTVLTGLAAGSLPALPANADYSLTLSLNEKTTGSNGTKEIPISGAELTAMKVADLTISDGYPDFTSIPAFADLAVNYDGMTTDQSNKVAAKMAKKIATDPDKFTPENGVQTMKDVTDESGKVTFSGDSLVPGMYLIQETGRTGKALDYEIINPYLVAVPEYYANEWIINVEAEPKMEPAKVPPPPTVPVSTTEKPSTATRTTAPPVTRTTTTPAVTKKTTVVKKIAKWVNTDDGTRIVMWSTILVVSAVAMIIIIRKRKELEKN